MSFIRKYRVIWTQGIVFILLGFFRKKDILIILSCILLSFPLLFPAIAMHYINATEKIIHTIGRWIKNILFTLLFALVIIPLSTLNRKDKKNKYSSFVNADSKKLKTNFGKMW